MYTMYRPIPSKGFQTPKLEAYNSVTKLHRSTAQLDIMLPGPQGDMLPLL